MIQVLLLAALAAVGLGVVFEAGSRWWLRRRSRYQVWPAAMRQEIRLARDVFPELEPRVRFEINADGERGDEVPRDAQRLFRVLATGGSAVECFALDQATSWPSVLQRLLNEAGSLGRVHIGNIGHSGVGAAELDRIFERVLPQYGKVNLILIMVGTSDVYHWIEQGAPPSRPAALVPEPLLFGSYPRQSFGYKPGSLALAEVARRLRRRWLHPVEIKERAGAWQAKGRRMRAEATDVRHVIPDATAMVKNFEDYFRRACRRAMAHADRVVVLLQPWFDGPYTPEEAARFWHGAVGKPWRDTIKTYYSLDVMNRLLDLVHQRAAAVAAELGLEQVNLRAVLTERVRHYFDHDHFTPAGAALVAETVANTVVPAQRRVPRATIPTSGHHLQAQLG